VSGITNPAGGGGLSQTDADVRYVKRDGSSTLSPLLFVSLSGDNIEYVNNVGPKWGDANTGMELEHNVQSLTSNRTVTWPNKGGIVAMTSDIKAIVSTHASSLFGKTSDTTLEDVPFFSVALPAGVFELRLNLFIGQGAGRAKFKLTGTCAIDTNQSMMQLTEFDGDNVTATPHGFTSNLVSGFTVDNSGSEVRAEVVGVLTVTTAGSLKLQFAQEVSDTTASSIQPGSVMVLTQIS
jgi:hypothetical protein